MAASGCPFSSLSFLPYLFYIINKNQKYPSEYFIKPGKHIIQVKKDGYLPSEEKEFNVDYDIYESKQDREENLTFLLSKKE